jgi:hypothetical protein
MKDIKWNKTNFKNPIAIACGTTETEDGNKLLYHFKLLPVKKTFWQKIWEKLFKMKYKISILTIIFLVLYNIKFISFLLTYSFLIYEYAEVIYCSFIVFLILILWLFVDIYVAICRSPIVNQCKETDIKLPAPTPLPNNNIKIEIYETKR